MTAGIEQCGIGDAQLPRPRYVRKADEENQPVFHVSSDVLCRIADRMNYNSKVRRVLHRMKQLGQELGVLVAPVGNKAFSDGLDIPSFQSGRPPQLPKGRGSCPS